MGGTGTHKDRNEVNRREFCECDGWVCDLEAIGAHQCLSWYVSLCFCGARRIGRKKRKQKKEGGKKQTVSTDYAGFLMSAWECERGFGLCQHGSHWSVSLSLFLILPVSGAVPLLLSFLALVSSVAFSSGNVESEIFGVVLKSRPASNFRQRRAKGASHQKRWRGYFSCLCIQENKWIDGD